MKRTLPLAALLLTGCNINEAWTVHLSPEGVDIQEGTHEPRVQFQDREMLPDRHQHFEGNILMSSPDQLLNGERLEFEFSDDGNWERLPRSLQIGEDTVFALRYSVRGLDFEERIQVMRYESGVWVKVADFDRYEGELYSRHGHAPVLYNPDDGSVRTLDGDDFGERLAPWAHEVLVAGDVLFEVLGWEDTREVRTAAERRQQRILGPDCEALLAGEMAAVIATPEGLETLSIVSNQLHHERVLPDCSVELIEKVYHPEQGFEARYNVQAGEQAWAFWTGNQW